MLGHGLRSSTEGQRVQVIKGGIPNYDLPGIPHAIQRRKLNEVDKEFEKNKKKLAPRLPLLTDYEIAIHRFPYHIILIHQLSNEGHCRASMELQMIIKQEDYEMEHHLLEKDDRLVCDKELLKTITDSLKYSWDLIDRGQCVMAIAIRRTMAEYLLKYQDKIWLSKHMYRTILDLSVYVKDREMSNKIKSETKCLLGSATKSVQTNNGSTVVKEAIILLEEARDLSKGQTWTCESKILVIKLKKPICFLGLRQGCEDIACHSLKIYNVATLLLYEMFMSSACQMISSVLTDFSQPMEFCVRALGLAQEINHPTALTTAHMTLGMINWKMGHFEKACENFINVQKLSHFLRDHETEAVALNFLGRCYVELNDSTTGLDMFVRQREIGEIHNLKDLEANALEHIGRILLEEGQTMESELCYMEAYDRLLQLDDNDDVSQSDLDRLTTHAWVMKGIAAGSNLWSRFAGHCHHDEDEWKNFDQIWKWKINRVPIQPVPRPKLDVTVLTDFFTKFEDSKSKIPMRETQSIVDSIVEANKNLLPNDMLGVPSITDDKFVESQQERSLTKQVDKKEDEDEDEGKEVHFKVENTRKKSQGEDKRAEYFDPNLTSQAALLAKKFDEGLEIMYESDLSRMTVMRDPSDHHRYTQGQLLVGDTVGLVDHLGVHITRGGSHSRNNSKATMIPTMIKPPVHGGISLLDMVARPSLNFNISSLSRNNYEAYESHFQIHDYKTKYSVDLSVQRRKASRHRRQSKIMRQPSVILKPFERVSTPPVLPIIDPDSSSKMTKKDEKLVGTYDGHVGHHIDKQKFEAIHKLTSHMGTHLMVLPHPSGPGSKIFSGSSSLPSRPPSTIIPT